LCHHYEWFEYKLRSDRSIADKSRSIPHPQTPHLVTRIKAGQNHFCFQRWLIVWALLAALVRGVERLLDVLIHLAVS